jgi:hypothetical protein
LTQAPGPGSAISISLGPATLPADGASGAVATATVTDANGNRAPGDSVSFTTDDAGAHVGPVTDNGDGTYSAAITSSLAVHTVSVTAVDASQSPALLAGASLVQVPAPVPTPPATAQLPGPGNTPLTTSSPGPASTPTPTPTHLTGGIAAGAGAAPAAPVCTLPNFHGLTRAGAARALRRAHCTNVVLSFKGSGRTATAQSVKAGKRITRLTHVAVVLAAAARRSG